MMKFTRHALGGVCLAACLAAALPATAQTDPGHPGAVDGRVTITERSVAVGVGVTRGEGTLYYRRHTYHFSVRGVTVAAVGFSEVVGHGRVYNLHRLEDFNGTYAASTGEVTAGHGIAGQALVNGKGVQIRIDSVTSGAELSGSADGIQIELRR